MRIMTDPNLPDPDALRDLIENWAIWRDAGHWEHFARVWHDGGWMLATWFQGSAADFIRVTQEGWSKGLRILHFLCGTSIEFVDRNAL